MQHFLLYPINNNLNREQKVFIFLMLWSGLMSGALGVTADSYWRRQVTTAWKVTNRNLMGTNTETSPNLTEVKIKRNPKKEIISQICFQCQGHK